MLLHRFGILSNNNLTFKLLKKVQIGFSFIEFIDIHTVQSFDEAAVSHETKRAQKQKSVEKSASEAIRQRLGGWLAVATSGGAALRPDVAEFVRKHLQLQVRQ